MSWGLQHAIQYAGSYGEVELFFDPMYAGDLAQAHSRPSTNIELTKIIAGLALLAAQFSGFAWSHESGHANLPWNECVDVAAKKLAIAMNISYWHLRLVKLGGPE